MVFIQDLNGKASKQVRLGGSAPENPRLRNPFMRFVKGGHGTGVFTNGVAAFHKP
jgi:hypothetical protein